VSYQEDLVAKTEKTESMALLFTVKSAGYYKRDGVELVLSVGDIVSLTPEQLSAFPSCMRDKLVPVQEVSIRKPLSE